MTELIYCAARSNRFSELAIRYGFTYGAQLPSKIYRNPEFIDNDWNKPDRSSYMAALKQCRPRIATVLDWEFPEQKEEVFSWAEEAAQYVSETIIIIPKVSGTIPEIPDTICGRKIRLGYPVPLRKPKSKFAGKPLFEFEYGDREMHLLGGSPQRQFKIASYLNVKSIDNNYFQARAVNDVQFFSNGGSSRYAQNRYFPKMNETKLGHITEDAPYIAFEMSCMNIQAMWNNAPCCLRFAVDSDIGIGKEAGGIIKIRKQYSKELGAPHYPAMRSAVNRREIIVAEFDELIVGYVYFHRRKDGWNTIYEIATASDWTRHKIATGLLCGIPYPIQLKCPVDNPANKFYEQQGFQFMGQEKGIRRELNIWNKTKAA